MIMPSHSMSSPEHLLMESLALMQMMAISFVLHMCMLLGTCFASTTTHPDSA